jgi:hypothetical protein
MKLLCFQAERFGWKSHTRTLDDADEEPVEGRVENAVVVFFHADAKDQDEDERKRVFKGTLKHIKWLANKRELKNVVLHSFTHLGAENAAPDFARGFITDMTERLQGTGYAVETTPFGWFCSWDLAVFGESLAKVWKEI